MPSSLHRVNAETYTDLHGHELDNGNTVGYGEWRVVRQVSAEWPISPSGAKFNSNNFRAVDYINQDKDIFESFSQSR